MGQAVFKRIQFLCNYFGCKASRVAGRSSPPFLQHLFYKWARYLYICLISRVSRARHYSKVKILNLALRHSSYKELCSKLQSDFFRKTAVMCFLSVPRMTLKLETQELARGWNNATLSSYHSGAGRPWAGLVSEVFVPSLEECHTLPSQSSAQNRNWKQWLQCI